MNVEQKKIVKVPEIILKELNQEAPPGEMEILNEWLSQAEEIKTLYQKLRQKENIVSIIKEYSEIDVQNAWEKVLKQISHKNDINETLHTIESAIDA
jgi:N-acetyl-gamma-glutamylphosphate reductase